MTGSAIRADRSLCRLTRHQTNSEMAQGTGFVEDGGAVELTEHVGKRSEGGWRLNAERRRGAIPTFGGWQQTTL